MEKVWRTCFLWLSAAVALRSSSASPFAAISAPEDFGEKTALHEVLHWSRSGPRGRAQKKKFIEEGLRQGLLSLEYPFLTTSPASTNYLADHKVAIVEGAYNRHQASHEQQERDRQRQAAEEERRQQRSSVHLELPERVTWYRLDQQANQFLKAVPQGSLSLTEIQRDQVKILFLDHHQVLDRSRSGTSWELQRIPEVNLEKVENWAEQSEGADFHLFVLSYVHTEHRLTEVLELYNSSDRAKRLFNGIIFTREPTGDQGKVAVIKSFVETLDVNHQVATLIDDKAEILEELHQTYSRDLVEAVHIKLNRKRSLHHSIEYPISKFLEDQTCCRAIELFLQRKE